MLTKMVNLKYIAKKWFLRTSKKHQFWVIFLRLKNCHGSELFLSPLGNSSEGSMASLTRYFLLVFSLNCQDIKKVWSQTKPAFGCGTWQADLWGWRRWRWTILRSWCGGSSAARRPICSSPTTVQSNNQYNQKDFCFVGLRLCAMACAFVHDAVVSICAQMNVRVPLTISQFSRGAILAKRIPPLEECVNWKTQGGWDWLPHQAFPHDMGRRTAFYAVLDKFAFFSFLVLERCGEHSFATFCVLWQGGISMPLPPLCPPPSILSHTRQGFGLRVR